MKKLIAIIVTIFSFIGIGYMTVFAEETSTEPTTEPATNIETTESTVQSYIYSDYDDLVNQLEEELYDDIYQEVYDEVYEDILLQFTSEAYDSIYDDIELSLQNRLAELNILNDDTQNKIYDVVEIANQTVVGIENYLGTDGVSVGSGVIYDYDSETDLYYLITNYHVIEDGDNYKVRFENENTVTANLLNYDADADIALLSFSGEDLDVIQVAALGSSSDLKKGQILIAAGHSQGFDFFNSITFGVVAGLDRMIDGESITFIQHDAAINSGNSGGPIFNLDGEVVGINVLKYADEEIEGMGFSIPIDLVIEIIENS
ncbi:MAG TPA: S1C family serine protease [Candidatus Izemoplasmatales bacterium]|nr:S1C family serine protease [Candidatus Izemoplasmatales bacterium]